MNWLRAITAVVLLWSSAVWGATLTWSPTGESDLAGYRVYQCNLVPCTRASGNASLLTTLGIVTSFNIGTPTVTQYYFVTAYDLANNESAESTLATFIPTGITPPAIGASPVSLSFTATEGGANPATQTLSISNTGNGTLSWNVSDNAAWLTLSPASGAGNGAVMLSVATGTLTAGSYNGTVTISATGASSVIVPVVLTVVSPSVGPPAIGTSPISFFFTATEGSANPATQTLSISNTGGGTLSWDVSDNAAWLTLSPASGAGNGAVMLSVATGTLTAGSYNGTVTISATGASSVTVPVVFDVSTFRSGKKTSPSTPRGLHLSLGKIK